ncbi:MAG TPA: cobalamin-dependent protein [bacterium]|nr:cobalamin-dependent protein [bacterium]HPQ65195.1 cobalamin-dependent protein [bacterium]
MSIDVLFIHPGAQGKTYQGLAVEFTAVAPPIWTGMLAAHAQAAGRSAAVFDANLLGWGENSAEELLRRYGPALVAIPVYGHHPSASTQTMPAASRIARDLKNADPGLPVAMGGLHPTALPERTLREEAIDYVIRGEGCLTIPALLEALRSRTGKSRVPGLAWLEGGRAVLTPPAPTVADLDAELGRDYWDFLPPPSSYRSHNMHCFQDFSRSRQPDFSDVRSPYATLQTSLGCPFDCSYCCTNSLFGGPGIRYWSLETVMAWIDRLAGEFGVRNIRLDDELFLLDERRVERFCDLLLDRGLDLNLWAYGRVDTVRPRLLEKMKRAGFNWLCLGIESAVERVRAGAGKRYGGSVREVVGQVQAAGINVLGNFMFGLPDDDLDTMNRTLELALELNCEFVNFYSVMAYPGSRLYREPRGGDGGRPPADWEEFSQHGPRSRPLGTRHLDGREVLSFRDRAFETYFRAPRYLALIERKFGNKVTEHIRRMLDIKLARDPWEPGKERKEKLS